LKACWLSSFNPTAFPVFPSKMGMIREDIDVFVVAEQFPETIIILATVEIDVQRGPLTGSCFLLIRV
jgi:hypothetical protein